MSARYAVALLAAVGCATTVRLDAKFDSDPLGARPVQAPSPTPPNDQLTWTSQKPLSSTVVVDPVGGRWVRVAPLPPFVASPDPRQLVLIASTDTLTTSPPAKIRGSLRLRLDNLGVVALAFQPMQGARLGDFIGGIELANLLGPSGRPTAGSVNILPGFALNRVDDIFPFSTGGTLGTVPVGTAISISWSIDQVARTFSASIAGGARAPDRRPPAGRRGGWPLPVAECLCLDAETDVQHRSLRRRPLRRRILIWGTSLSLARCSGGRERRDHMAMALMGETVHFSIRYEGTSTDAFAIAQAILGVCESNFNTVSALLTIQPDENAPADYRRSPGSCQSLSRSCRRLREPWGESSGTRRRCGAKSRYRWR